MTLNRFNHIKVLCLVATLFVQSTAYAYIGPGVGLTAVGTFVALVIIIVIAIAGFLWFPIKRIIKNRQAQVQKDSTHE
jgi:membrane-bound ClpP family serine protease